MDASAKTGRRVRLRHPNRTSPAIADIVHGWPRNQAACTGAPTRNGVCHLHNDALNGFIWVLFVVGLHGFDDVFGDAKFLQDTAAYLHMGALHLMVERFADVMEERASTGRSWVGAELLGDHPGNMRHFY